jgi:hypothetical protein
VETNKKSLFLAKKLIVSLSFAMKRRSHHVVERRQGIFAT